MGLLIQKYENIYYIRDTLYLKGGIINNFGKWVLLDVFGLYCSCGSNLANFGETGFVDDLL